MAAYDSSRNVLNSSTKKQLFLDNSETPVKNENSVQPTPERKFDGIPTHEFYSKHMRIPDFSRCFPALTEEDKIKADRKRRPKKPFHNGLRQPGVEHNIKRPKVRKTQKNKSLNQEKINALMICEAIINTPPASPEEESKSPKIKEAVIILRKNHE